MRGCGENAHHVMHMKLNLFVAFKHSTCQKLYSINMDMCTIQTFSDTYMDEHMHLEKHRRLRIMF